MKYLPSSDGPPACSPPTPRACSCADLPSRATASVLRDSAAATVIGNALAGNAATDVRVASPFTAAPSATGAGVWITGGRAHRVHGNTLHSHTYNVAVTGPAPVTDTRIAGNIVGKPIHADLGWDGLGAGVCFTGSSSPEGAEPTSDPPPDIQTTYDCALPGTIGVPYPVVTANLAAHALRVGPDP